MQTKSPGLVLFVLLSAGTTRADVKQTELKLAGNNAQKWIAESVETVMGSGGCTKGETWRFKTDHSVEIRKCIDGKLNSKKSSWSLAEESSLDTVITVGEMQYYVTFYKKTDGSYMQLKSISHSKVDGRVNKEFRLEDE